MRTRPFPLAVAVALAASSFVACDDVPVDNGTGSRLIAPSGVIEGTVLYQGPHPCTQDGHVVGNLILLYFDKNNPPPPAGVASTAVNFGVVQGDVLFQNEPRASGSAKYCPSDNGDTEVITASAPFADSPFAAGTYIIEAFFDYTGDFLPTFKFRELPEMGDVAGGYIDTTDAILHADAGVDYKPIFLPVTVGVPAGTADASLDGAGVGADGGALVLPSAGYVANNVAVSVGSVLPLPRPYFYIDGTTAPATKMSVTSANPSGNVDYVPAQMMAQDIHILAQPPVAAISEATIAAFQASLTGMTFRAGVPANELSAATTAPFNFQLTAATAATSLFAWTDGTTVPESTLISNLLPQIVFTKLIDDPDHTLDPQGITQQVPPTGPIVVILGLNMGPQDGPDSLLTLVGYPIKAPGPMAAVDHLNALVRPLAVCVDPSHPEAGATLVAPFLTGTSADPGTTGPQPLFDETAVDAALTPIFGKVNPAVVGCLPPGRYAPNLVYPTGQAWTLPNESGSCAADEGALQTSANAKSPATGASCAGEGGAGRPVLFSQGTRGVLEVTETKGSPTCAAHPVPKVCLPAVPGP
jgi:hypothetical protein